LLLLFLVWFGGLGFFFFFSFYLPTNYTYCLFSSVFSFSSHPSQNLPLMVEKTIPEFYDLAMEEYIGIHMCNSL